MGVLLDILSAEHFRNRPMMYAGSRNLREIGYWIRGIEFCYAQLRPDEPAELDGFREWLHMKLDGPGNTDWVGILETVLGDGAEATKQMFEYLDEFRTQLNDVGLEQIIADHAKYEMERYEFLSSSRLRES